MRFPVLMYHKVGEPVHMKADRFLNVSTIAFERQMTLLASMKFRVRPFAEIVERRVDGTLRHGQYTEAEQGLLELVCPPESGRS